MQRLINRKLARITPDGLVPVKLKFEETNLYDFFYIVTDDVFECIVGVLEHQKSYLVGDRVEISGDRVGYICPGICHPGLGSIISISCDDADYFYDIQMDNGEYGRVKSARIKILGTD